MNFIYTWPTWAIVTAGLAVALAAAAGVALRFADDWFERAVFGAAAFVSMGVFSVVLPMAMRESADYATWCAAQGGTVSGSTDVAPVVGGNGGVAVTSTTYCLTDDGRVIDVQ